MHDKQNNHVMFQGRFIGLLRPRALAIRFFLFHAGTDCSALPATQLTAAGRTVASAALQVVVNPLPTINAQQVGNNLILRWPQRTLLQTTNLAGTWVTNSAISPYTNPAVAPQMFYKLRLQ